VLLLALIRLDLDSELGNLLLVLDFSAIELLNVGEVKLLALNAAHLLPDTEAFVDQLSIKPVGGP
jgi:hypothetical protein